MVLGEGESELLDGLLDFESGANCLYRTGEFGDDAVASAAKYPAFMGANDPVNPQATLLKDSIGPLLIGAHHAGIARTVGTKDGR